MTDTTPTPRRLIPPITCGGCTATWTGTRACHCGGCHRTFAGIALFDKHRAHHGEHGRCLDPATLTVSTTGKPVMYLRDGIWSGPEMTEEQKLAAFGDKSHD